MLLVLEDRGVGGPTSGVADVCQSGSDGVPLVTRETLKRAFKRLNGTGLNTVRYGT